MLSTNKSTSNKQLVFYFVILVAIYITPILLTSRPYIDDLGRIINGNTGWSENGRPLADLIMRLMSLGKPLVDLSPLNQILSVIALCTSIYFYTLKNFTDINRYGALIASFLFISNPFYIENLSYKYDSLPMALSMVMLLLPFILSLKGIVYHITTIIFIIASLSLYQAAIGLFPILVILDIITKKHSIGNKKITISIIPHIVNLIIAFILYKLFIANPLVDGEYNIAHSETLALSLSSVSILLDNIKSTKWLLDSYLSSFPLIFKILFALAIIYSISKEIYCLFSKAIKKNIISSFVIILSPILVLALALTPLLTLKFPVIAPRVMLSTSGVFLLYTYLIFRNIKPTTIKAILLFPIVWMSIVYSYSYSSSTRSQQNLDDLISKSIYQNVLLTGKEFRYVNISGEMPKSSQLLIARTKLPLMEKLIPIYMSNDWIWGAILLNHYGFNLEYKNLGNERNNLMCSSHIISKNQTYNLYYKDDILFIDFNKIKC